MSVKTRFAPSPTGYLHIGGLRTALYNFLFARNQKGIFALRIEDTDRERYVEGAVDALLRTLNIVGLSYDEGPVVQSERLPMYKKFAQELVEKGHAYYCFCSSDRLEQLREQQRIAKLATKYDRTCTKLDKSLVEQKLSAGEKHVIRLRIPDGETVFEDVVRGTIKINNEEVDDQVLLKSDGFPTYHLAVVVDDHEMGVTHVIRAEEWLSSVPKHVALYRAFGWDLPTYAHIPLVLNPDRSKLSKRQGDVAVEDYLAKGYLPQALVNFVALLGFNPKADQEIYTMQELIDLFDLTKINKSGAVFNIEKLDWMNGEYIRALSPDQLVSAVAPFIEKAGKSVDERTLIKICTVEQGRMVRLTDVIDKLDGYLSMPVLDPTLLVWKKSDAADAKAQIAGVLRHLEAADVKVFDDMALLEQSVKSYIGDSGLQNGNVLWPMRVSLSGKTQSPSPFELAWVLGREETLKRLSHALEKL